MQNGYKKSKIFSKQPYYNTLYSTQIWCMHNLLEVIISKHHVIKVFYNKTQFVAIVLVPTQNNRQTAPHILSVWTAAYKTL